VLSDHGDRVEVLVIDVVRFVHFAQSTLEYVRELQIDTRLKLGSLPFDVAPELRPMTPISAAALSVLSIEVYQANLCM